MFLVGCRICLVPLRIEVAKGHKSDIGLNFLELPFLLQRVCLNWLVDGKLDFESPHGSTSEELDKESL